MIKNPVFVIAPDSFKGSMSAMEVCDAIEKGIKKVLPEAECIKVPMADGGEGTVQSLVDATKGTICRAEVSDPLGRKIIAEYGISGDGETAFIEMASASGLYLLTEGERNPLITTTYGTGELVKSALDRGVKKIILGIGGSATNDGGAGFAQALGVKFLDEKGDSLPPGGAALANLHDIDISGMDIRLKSKTIEIEAACDVTNPLCGEKGASVVFGPQKGATSAMIKTLDKALFHYSNIIENRFCCSIRDVSGSGAAGGLGAGLLAFTDAHLKSGVDIVIDYTGLREVIKRADYVITGEGKIDKQTLYGKTPFGVARIARQEKKKVIAIAGSVGKGIDELYVKGFDAIFSILPSPMTLDEAMKTGKENIEYTVENITRLLNLR